MSYSQSSITNFIQQFQNCTLPKEQWTHQAHLVVALHYNWHYDFEEALSLVKNAIYQYNEAVGTANTSTSGYHETLTIFWMIHAKNFLLQGDFKDLATACQEYTKEEISSKKIPLAYYSKDLLFSIEARQQWQNGDLKHMKRA